MAPDQAIWSRRPHKPVSTFRNHALVFDPWRWDRTNRMAERAGTGGAKVLGGMQRAFAPWADPAAQPLVRFERVGKRYDGVRAVEAFSLDIFAGEFFALLGPSG